MNNTQKPVGAPQGGDKKPMDMRPGGGPRRGMNMIAEKPKNNEKDALKASQIYSHE